MATIIGSGLEGYLHRQARRRALNLIADAKDEARRTLEQATTEVEALRRRVQADTERAIDTERRRAVAQSHLQAKVLATSRVEEVLEELWQRAADELQRCAQTAPEERLRMIARLTRDAARQLDGGNLELAVHAADRPLLTPAFLQSLSEQLSRTDGVTNLALSDGEAPIWGGVIVVRPGANQLVDNSLDARLALVRRTLRDEAARLLTEEPSP